MTMAVRDIQSEIIVALQSILSPIASVEEGDVRAIFDAEDEDLPEEFIVLQPGPTDEVLNGHPRMLNSLPEQAVFNIVLVSRKRLYAPGLRAMRVAVKAATAGPKAGLQVGGISAVSFLQQTPTYPTPGGRWAAYVMPLQVTYTQPLA
ncbi:MULTISPECIES: hypothetical protein [unclassified Pseudomonas]|uniref:hypothetical protein n=1 Tax=unclassified Pseudomonas TaxID=196821 RepID=UPI002447D249|nr:MULTISPECIES: hypothetical protein [unclassified Pseudomonas]MDH0894225.1 hypothetical protein [Pseudomonas sp. GD03875]MDH1063480.1 hypothetical protein [Pseudomonas sp. GD03985]